jgi:adenosylcobinamide-phosphate synthase
VVILALASAGAGWTVTVLGSAAPFGWVAIVAVTMALIDQRRPFEEARRHMIHLEGGGAGDASAAVAALATGLAGGVIAATFWFALIGLPGLAAYRAIAVIAVLLDDRRSEVGVFGLAPSRLDEALLYLPAVLAGLVVAAAAMFVPGARPGRALGAVIRDAPKHHNLAHGCVIAAMTAGFSASPGALEVRRALYLYAVACLLNLALIALLAMASFAI